MFRKFSAASSVAIYIAAALIAASMFFPWWGMTFIAPQYPEGLSIIVYPNKMDGQIDIVNGLNHYIGMKAFSEDTFPELQIMPYLIWGMSLLTLITAIVRRNGVLYALLTLFIIGGAVGIYDIHQWLSDFGMNLSPQAPIKIAPFAPPVLGTNKIANFVTHSYFSFGSFLIGVAFVLITIPALMSVWKGKHL